MGGAGVCNELSKCLNCCHTSFPKRAKHTFSKVGVLPLAASM